MTKRARLIKEVREAMKLRGHEPAIRSRTMGNGSVLNCVRCGTQAVALPNPPPNLCEIYGGAVSQDCNG